MLCERSSLTSFVRRPSSSGKTASWLVLQSKFSRLVRRPIPLGRRTSWLPETLRRWRDVSWPISSGRTVIKLLDRSSTLSDDRPLKSLGTSVKRLLFK